MDRGWSVNEDFIENAPDVELQLLQEDPPPPAAPTSYTFEGVKVQFPLNAYPCQQQLMEVIITSVNSRKHCLLESDTGSGKTLAILCSLLAWLQKQEDQEDQPSPKKSREYHSSDEEEEEDTPLPTIYYVTKSLAHINQIIGQLRLTAYAKTPMGILASNVQTCNRETSRRSQRSHDPRNIPNFFIADNHYCPHDPKELKWARSLRRRECKTWTIEELMRFCDKYRTCPYYELLNANKDAKIIFCTYNYLLNPVIRVAMKIALTNNVVVFDDGHNVDELSRRIASTGPDYPLSTSKLSGIISVLNESLDSHALPNEKREPLFNLTEAFTKFRAFLIEETHTNVNGAPADNIAHWNFDNIREKLTANGLGPNQYSQLLSDYSILDDRPCAVEYNPEVAQFKIERRTKQYISNALFILGLLWEGNPTYKNSKYYKIVIETTRNPELGNANNGGGLEITPEVELHLICLQASVTFKFMKMARSVLIASGTLSPMDSLSLELGINFDTQFSATPMIPPERLYIGIVERHSASSNAIDLSYESWDYNAVDYKRQLALILRNICTSVPNGVVVFMPSRDRILKFVENWERNKHLRAIEKTIFVEPERAAGLEALNKVLEEYKTQADTDRGAVLFAVMRGRLSEGLEFRGKHGRAIVTIGIPFLPCDDLFVVAKREFQDERHRRNRRIINGWKWYSINAMKALNQASGRSLRHSNDWGVIIMVDSRLETNEDYRDMLTPFIRGSATTRNNEDCLAMPMTQHLPALRAFVCQMMSRAD